MIFKTIAVVSVIAFSTAAFSATRITCSGNALYQGKTQRTVSISADVVSAQELQNVSFSARWESGDEGTSTVAAMNGVEDPWDMSPQEGTRFYFHSGNTSEFLIFENGVLDSIANKSGVHFSANEIFEGYEEGGFQVISQLDCSTL